MTISRLTEHSIEALRAGAGPPQHAHVIGHSHFWERAMTRDVLLKRVVGVGGVAATSALWMPALARAGGSTTSAEPVPVPANPGGLHINLPGENAEPSSITNLNGFVGIGAAKGAGTATLATGVTQRLFFDVDNRFMTGEYVGADGKLHHGTFAFT